MSKVQVQGLEVVVSDLLGLGALWGSPAAGLVGSGAGFLAFHLVC